MASILNNSTTKARQAQKKFEEAKAKFEEVQAKAQTVAAKAKAVQQRIKETQAAFKAVGGIRGGGISAIVAVLVGNLRAQLILRIQKEVIGILNKFRNECPNPKDLQRVIKTRNNLLNNINSFQKRLDKLSKIAQTLLITVTAVRVAIKVITSIPVPTAIIPPITGGIGIPISILTKYSNALIKLNKILDKLIAEAAAIATLIVSVSAIIESLKARLDGIDIQIQACIQNPLQVLEQASVVESSVGNISQEDLYYKGYKLEIVQDVIEYKLAPRRHAIAIDKRGIVVLQGPSSFSSSTDILLDEIKFRIDQLL
jgi:hypothetical protein